MKDRIYACIWRHYGGHQIDHVWDEEEICNNHDGRVLYEDEKAWYVREDIHNDTVRIAYALSHGWSVGYGAWGYEEVNYDSQGEFSWDGKGIPPLTDELRTIIDEQMKTEEPPPFYTQENLKQKAKNSLLDALLEESPQEAI